MIEVLSGSDLIAEIRSDISSADIYSDANYLTSFNSLNTLLGIKFMFSKTDYCILPVRVRSYGIFKLVSTPVMGKFTQILGTDDYSNRKKIIATNEILRFLKEKFHIVNIALKLDEHALPCVSWNKYHVENQISVTCKLEEIRGKLKLSKGTKAEIGRARKNGLFLRSGTFDELKHCIAATYGRQNRVLPKSIERYSLLLNSDIWSSSLNVVCHENSTPLAANLIVRHSGKSYYFLGGATSLGRQTGAQTFLLTETLFQEEKRSTIFDFEGSIKKSILMNFAQYSDAVTPIYRLYNQNAFFLMKVLN